MQRFQAYRSLTEGITRGTAFPLHVSSPMGQRRPDYFDALMALGTAAIAQKAAAATDRLAVRPEFIDCCWF